MKSRLFSSIILAAFALSIAGCGPDTNSIAEKVDARQKEAAKNASMLGTASAGKYKVGDLAEDIVGTDMDGEEFKLSDYRGKVVVLDFWGDW